MVQRLLRYVEYKQSYGSLKGEVMKSIKLRKHRLKSECTILINTLATYSYNHPISAKFAIDINHIEIHIL